LDEDTPSPQKSPGHHQRGLWLNSSSCQHVLLALKRPIILRHLLAGLLAW